MIPRRCIPLMLQVRYWHHPGWRDRLSITHLHTPIIHEISFGIAGRRRQAMSIPHAFFCRWGFVGFAVAEEEEECDEENDRRATETGSYGNFEC